MEEETVLEQRLRNVLSQCRYESCRGLGQRGLMEYHIDALVKDLVPFIVHEMADAAYLGAMSPMGPYDEG